MHVSMCYKCSLRCQRISRPFKSIPRKKNTKKIMQIHAHNFNTIKNSKNNAIHAHNLNTRKINYMRQKLVHLCHSDYSIGG